MLMILTLAFTTQAQEINQVLTVGEPPQNFTVQYIEGTGVVCAWDPPSLYVELGYDDGTNVNGLGLEDGGTFESAIRWNAGDLSPYNGWEIVGFKFYPIKILEESEFAFKLWEGDNASTLVYGQDVQVETWNDWNTIMLDEPFIMNTSVELWAGFEISHDAGENPLGYDGGPAITGYGDMISFDGETWETLTGYGMDCNYNLKILLSENSKSRLTEKVKPGTEDEIPSGFQSRGQNARDNLNFIGVNIYREGELMNETPVPPDENEFIYPYYEPGMWEYSAESVYEEGLSASTPVVVLYLPGWPEISVSPDSLSETHEIPSNTVTSQELVITNTGLEALEWEIEIGPEMGKITRHINSGVDVGVSMIVEPTSGVGFSDEEPITIRLKNYGSEPQSGIPWEVSYTGPSDSATFTGTWAESLAPGAMVDITMDETIDMTMPGNYVFEACTLLPGDEYPDNDCKTKFFSYPVEYCEATTTTEDEWIANVLCGDIDNSSGWQGGVADYTDITTNIPAGESESVTITNGNAWESDSVTIWVDWNMDYEFGVGTNEEFFTTNVGGTGETFEGEITVPPGTPDGNYRMRVRMTYSSAPEPCGEASYGEVEDYTIHVGEIPAGWLMVDKTGGVILPGESDTIMVSFDSEGLNLGSYNSALLITSNAQNNPLVKVPCSLQVSFETQSLVFEPFEDYNAGDYLVEQAVAQGKEYWTTWSGQPGSEEDPMVSDEQAFAGSNAMVIQQGNDAILQLPQIFGQGVFQVNFEILVPSGKTGYFNCLQLYDGGDSEWGMQCFFDIDGQGSVDAGGEGTGSFSYDYDTWNLVQLQIDLDSDHAKMFFNEEQIVEWQWSTGSFGSGTLNEFHALNFYGWDETGTPGAFFDNISIEADLPPIPDPPTDLMADVMDDEVYLSWHPSPEYFEPQWISYSGGNVTNSIGLDEPLNFDVAARWGSEDLEQFSNGTVTRIGFVPGEPGDICTYTLKVWSGFDNPTLIYSQELSDVEAHVWNIVELDSPVPFDNGQGLWIGFNCNTTAGYPAGCDDGPQVEGYSNMIYWDDSWITMTGLSPDLTYNWAIQGLLEYSGGEYVLAKRLEIENSLTFNVYMALDNEPFNLIAQGLTEPYYTNSYVPYETHIYYVTAVNEYGGESEPSNEVTVYVGPPVPDPPYNLQYEIVDDSVHLFWQQSAPGLVDVYYVYRDGAVTGYPGEQEYYDPLPDQFPVEYYVAAYSYQSGLTDTSNHVIVHNPQGIMEQNTNIHLFPNPSDEHLTIEANYPPQNEI